MNKFYDKEFSKIFEDPNALREFYELLDRYGMDDAAVWRGVNSIQDAIDNKEDVASWLISEGYTELSDNTAAVEMISQRALSRWNSEYGTWDNIGTAFDWLRNYTTPTEDAVLKAIKEAVSIYDEEQ